MTAKLAPLEIDDLHREVVSLIHQSNLDVGRLHQIEVRIDRLLRTTATPRLTCFSTLFLISFALGNRLKTEQFIADAMSELPLNLSVLENAIKVLTNVGSHAIAMELIRVMVAAFPDSKSAMESAMIGCQVMLRLSSALEFLDRLDKLSVNEPQ